MKGDLPSWLIFLLQQSMCQRNKIYHQRCSYHYLFMQVFETANRAAMKNKSGSKKNGGKCNLV